MSKRTFFIRLTSFIIFGLIIPFGFLTMRFELFTKTSKIKIGGWGMVAIILVAVFFNSLLKSVRKGMPFSFTVHVMNGIAKIIPLLAITAIIYLLKDSIEQTFQFMCVLVVCESIALIVNPVPEWMHQKGIDQKEDRINNILSKVIKHD